MGGLKKLLAIPETSGSLHQPPSPKAVLKAPLRPECWVRDVTRNWFCQ